jgi:hypothetical protein
MWCVVFTNTDQIGRNSPILNFTRILSAVPELTGIGNRDTTVGIRRADHVAPSIRKTLALTSPTRGGRSVGIVRWRTQAMEFVSLLPAERQRGDNRRLFLQLSRAGSTL